LPSQPRQGTWIEPDLSGAADLPLVPRAARRAAFVCVDVIEHLERPDRLIRQLRRLLGPGLPTVLTTPDRELPYGAGHVGPPPNPEQAREWTASELEAFPTDEGFPGAELRLVGEPVPRTILAVLRGS
jgi:hypothetical protein